MQARRETDEKTPIAAARREVLLYGILAASMLLFVGTGGSFFSQMLAGSAAHNRMLAVALILNVALVLFSWRRYRDLEAEIHERGVAEERAGLLAITDPLTGLFNRRSLSERGAGLLSQARRREKAAIMFVLDLDNFKLVNDLHGHSVGDLVLKSAAARIERLLPPGALTARLGGDEFACVFLNEPNRPEIAEHLADEIVSAMARPFLEEGLHITTSASLGIAQSDMDCETIDALMRRADIAMYASKNGGRNRSCWFSPAMERELQARNRIEADMRAGIPRGEFVPYYEQQVDLASGRITGFEMLARWERPNEGLILPDIFIPVAEETGLISDLSLSVMRQALEEARSWDSALTLSVNISPAQLKDPWLSQKILKLLVETGFPPERLEVEITESSLFENLSLAQSIVGSLKNQGIRIALDDFGTGYSSLAHLRALPFDRIKIDRSFVSAIPGNSENVAIVAAIARLGESLGLPVTAEGIESEDARAQLVAMGCSKGQGWLFGRPAGAAETCKLLARHNLLPAARGHLGQAGKDGATVSNIKDFRRSA